MTELRVGGLVPLSTTDYPGRLAAVVFFQGCPWRCGYCHNPHLWPADTAPLAWPEVLHFLERRAGLLDAVVLSGGEPTAQPGIVAAAHQIKQLGFRVGLHTAGIYPTRLAALLPQLDWVGMDIKAPFDAYDPVTGVPGSGEKARECARLILQSGVAHEFRTTVHPDLLPAGALLNLVSDIKRMGAHSYAVQVFRAQGCTDAALNTRGGETFLNAAFCREIAAEFDRFSLRLN